MSTPSPIQIIGHRGTIRLENTITSLTHAINQGADGVEFDIQLCKDNIPVIIHDDTLDRTTSCAGSIHDIDRNQLRTCFALYPDGSMSDDSVPTLEAWLNIASEFTNSIPHLWLNIEIKDEKATGAVFQIVKAFISDKKLAASNILLSSFNIDVLYTLRKLSDTLPIGLLPTKETISNLASYVDDLHPQTIHASQHVLGLPELQTYRGKIPLVAWFEHEPIFPENIELVKEAIARGAEKIITNYPQEVAALTKEGVLW